MYVRPAVGIDIGKRELFLATSRTADKPRNWEVIVLKLATNTTWCADLIALIPPDAVIAYEPTGFWMSFPIIQAINHHRPDAIMLTVNHTTTAHVRQMHIAAAKTDAMDSRALAWLADAQAQGLDIRGTRSSAGLHPHALTLRVLLNARARHVRSETRARNQLSALVHALYPASVGMNTIIAGGIQPDPDSLKNNASKASAKRLAAGATPNPPQILLEMATEMINDIHTLTPRIEKLEAKIAGILAEHYASITTQLMTIPSNSPMLIACIVVATDGDPASLTRDRFRAALGVAPMTSQSGKVDRTKLAKKGYRPAASALHMLTFASLRDNTSPLARYFYLGNHSMAATRRKCADILYGVMLSDKPYRPSPPFDLETAREARRKSTPTTNDTGATE